MAAEVAAFPFEESPRADVTEAVLRRALGDPGPVAAVGDFDDLVRVVGIVNIARVQAPASAG
ncbi:hypothetical protein [Actinacidiphila rubida]|uniref:hypothetical protein n=1 Tax=Actinacidiphila rubida TaxID=310780 RepID=UPI000942051E|nr:hypothetical protein [Actinacidiphila rubida]